MVKSPRIRPLSILLHCSDAFDPEPRTDLFRVVQVTKLRFDYTDCDISAPTDGTEATMPSNKFDCEAYSVLG